VILLTEHAGLAPASVAGITEARTSGDVRGPFRTTGVNSRELSTADGGDACPPRTLIDWWAWRSRAAIGAVKATLTSIFSHVPGGLCARDRRGGFQGYDASADLFVRGEHVGVLAWAGAGQANWIFVEIRGEGCALIRDWALAESDARRCRYYEIRRLDIAFDTFETGRSVHTAREAYRAGQFFKRGRRPKDTMIGSDAPQYAATLQIGNRQSPCFARIYEKGKKELKAQKAADYLKDPTDPFFDDFAASHGIEASADLTAAQALWHWCRHEIELKPKNTLLPHDVIARRDHYFAGSYPYMAELLEGVAPANLWTARQRKGAPPSMLRSLAYAKRQFGRIFFSALQEFDGDQDAVWAQIVGDRPSKMFPVSAD